MEAEIERLLGEIEQRRSQLAGMADDPDAAAALLGEIGSLVQQTQGELERARQAIRDADR